MIFVAIIIVDDSRVFRTSLEHYLIEAGYKEVILLSSAVELFSFLYENEKSSEKVSVDVILMDIIMPDMDGIEATRRLKENELYEGIQVIMITATEEEDSVIPAFEAGAIDYINKPVSQLQLLARVRSSLRLKREMDHRKAVNQELIKINEELHKLAATDVLTGISNRRHFDYTIEKEWRRAARYSEELALIIIDVDHFKLYNDFYGHVAGDHCLKKVALAIKRALKRPVDFCARYGGEEFIVLLPDTDLNGGQVVGEVIRNELAGDEIKHEKSKVAEIVTLSMGVSACTPDLEINPYELVKCADEALYEAKRSRNMLVTRAFG